MVELLLNLCWLALLLPAFLLWQRRNPSDRSTRRSLLFACTLACLLVLLFPFISASDDLHAGAQVIEESKRTLRGSHGAGTLSVQALASFSSSAMPPASAFPLLLERAGTVLEFSPHSSGTFAAVLWIGRAPPV